MDFILPVQLDATRQVKGSLIYTCQENATEMVGIKASFILSLEQSFICSHSFILSILAWNASLCTETALVPQSCLAPSILRVVWLKSDCAKMALVCPKYRTAKRGGTGSCPSYAYRTTRPPLVVCHFCTVIYHVKQLQVCFHESTWSTFIFTVNTAEHENQTQGEHEIMSRLCGLKPLKNWTQWVRKPQRNDKEEPHSMISLPLSYLSNISRGKVYFRVTLHYFLDILCCYKILQVIQELIAYFF